MTNKTYQIRYNNQSTSNSDRWRLIEDGQEILVSNVIVDGQVQTTKDWVENADCWKWHISCVGNLKMVGDVAYIKTIKKDNSIARHLAKTISWRIIGTLDTMLLGWWITGSLHWGLAIGGTEVVTKMVLYFIHERIWFKWIKLER
jgi:uncharacterized membrane protein